MEPDEQGRKSRLGGGEIGRLAGKIVKNAGPRTKQLIDENKPRVEKAIQDARPKIEKAVEEYRPKVEQAGRDALRYAQEHEDEIRAMALKGARMRLGPLGMAIDALGIGGEPAQPAAKPGTCSKCGSVNAVAARFCAQCGAALVPPPADNRRR